MQGLQWGGGVRAGLCSQARDSSPPGSGPGEPSAEGRRVVLGDGRRLLCAFPGVVGGLTATLHAFLVSFRFSASPGSC